MKTTWWMPLLAVTFVGVLVGVVGDFLGPDDVDFTARDILTGVVLSPLIVTLGGAAVAPRALSPYFLVGGFTFWPVYLLLAGFWIRTGRRWLLVAIFLWTVQGFFQIGHRMAVMSGV